MAVERTPELNSAASSKVEVETACIFFKPSRASRTEAASKPSHGPMAECHFLVQLMSVITTAMAHTVGVEISLWLSDLVDDDTRLKYLLGILEMGVRDVLPTAFCLLALPKCHIFCARTFSISATYRLLLKMM